MQLLAFPRGRSSSRFFERERLVSREARQGWRLTVLGKRRRGYSLQASLETLERRLLPCRVTLDGRKLKRSRGATTRVTRTLTVRFRTKHGTLVVRAGLSG